MCVCVRERERERKREREREGTIVSISHIVIHVCRDRDFFQRETEPHAEFYRPLCEGVWGV